MSTNPFGSLYGPLYGSIYFSAIMTTAFYGVTCMQTFFYYVHYQDDPLRMKIFVAVIWALNTIHEALTVAGAYKYIMSGLVNPWSFLNGVPELIVLPTALIAVLTQGFLVHRIYVFSGKKIITLFIWLILAILQLVPCTIYVGKALYSANGLRAVEITILSDNTLTTLITLGLSVAAGEDILIAIFLVFLLVRERSSASFSSTAHILQRLTVFAVNTGMWTATFALLSVILLHVFPSNMLYVVFIVPLCSVYCNTLLANLNARAYIRDGTTTQNVSTDLFASSSEFDRQRGEAKLVFATQETVYKTTEVVTFSDATRSTTSEDV